MPPHRPLPAPSTDDEHEAADRPPLRAGHPISWAALTSGTLLDGVAFPWPPLPVAA
jgi:hypothetical protein